jgi:hypothetical protein
LKSKENLLNDIKANLKKQVDNPLEQSDQNKSLYNIQEEESLGTYHSASEISNGLPSTEDAVEEGTVTPAFSKIQNKFQMFEKSSKNEKALMIQSKEENGKQKVADQTDNFKEIKHHIAYQEPYKFESLNPLGEDSLGEKAEAVNDWLKKKNEALHTLISPLSTGYILTDESDYDSDKEKNKLTNEKRLHIPLWANDTNYLNKKIELQENTEYVSLFGCKKVEYLDLNQIFHDSKFIDDTRGESANWHNSQTPLDSEAKAKYLAYNCSSVSSPKSIDFNDVTYK